MSRCFPFPPIGYARNCAINEALIVSIKLQEQWQNSIPDGIRKKVNYSYNNKEKKREKKDKKKVRKDKKSDVKDKFYSVTESEKHFSNKSYKIDSSGKEFKAIERSNLTEEHGRPVNSQKTSRSSDSTESSCKRKWESPPASSIRGTGNIIRIRLSSQKRDDLNAMDSLPSQISDWASNIQEPSTRQNDVISKVCEYKAAIKETLLSQKENAQKRIIVQALV